MKVNNHLPDLVSEYKSKFGGQISQKDIAAESGVPESTLSRYLNFNVSRFDIEVEYKLCHFFTRTLGRQINRGDLISFEFETG